MVQIIDSRGNGKTSRLMLIAKDHGATFVCSNPYAMNQKALSYGITGIEFISYREFLVGYKGLNDKFVIDELDSFVNAMFTNGERFFGYTLTKE